jgi:nucleoid-associated protein YgaU
VLASVSERFVMFLPSGVPVRARLEVTFNEFTNDDLEAKETKRETADYSRVWVVAQGETLSGIAARVYADPAHWRPIAIKNRVDDPRALEVGQRLLIPRLPFRDPETGEVLR